MESKNHCPSDFMRRLAAGAMFCFGLLAAIVSTGCLESLPAIGVKCGDKLCSQTENSTHCPNDCYNSEKCESAQQEFAAEYAKVRACQFDSDCIDSPFVPHPFGGCGLTPVNRDANLAKLSELGRASFKHCTQVINICIDESKYPMKIACSVQKSGARLCDRVPAA